MVIGVITYLAAAGREARFLGRKMFFENLVLKATHKMRHIFIIFFSGYRSISGALFDLLLVGYRHDIPTLFLFTRRRRYCSCARHAFYSTVLSFFLQVTQTNFTALGEKFE